MNTNTATVVLSDVPGGHVIIRLPAGSASTSDPAWRPATTSVSRRDRSPLVMVSIRTSAEPHDWDKDVHHDELLAHLASLKSQTAQTTPILDDDDLEAAIDDAANRLTPN